MEMKSIHLPIISPFSINRPTPRVMMPQRITAVVRFMLKRVCQLSQTASNIFIRLVMPANSTDRKNTTAIS